MMTDLATHVSSETILCYNEYATAQPPIETVIIIIIIIGIIINGYCEHIQYVEIVHKAS